MISLGIAISTGLASPSYAAGVNGQPSDWRGFYVGATLGLSKTDADLNVTTQHTGNYFSAQDHDQVRYGGSKDFSPTDLNGNIFIGHNWQSGNWVYGFEATLSLMNFDEELHTPYTAYITAPAQSFRIDSSVTSHWNAKLLPRLGYARDKTLYFVSAGPALTRISYEFTYQDKAVNNEYSHLSTSAFALGWSAGLGLEHRFRDGWSLKSEISYTDFNEALNKRSSLKNYDDGFIHGIDYSVLNFQIGLVKRF